MYMPCKDKGQEGERVGGSSNVRPEAQLIYPALSLPVYCWSNCWFEGMKNSPRSRGPKNIENYRPGPVFSYKLRYIVGFGLVEMAIWALLCLNGQFFICDMLYCPVVETVNH